MKALFSGQHHRKSLFNVVYLLYEFWKKKLNSLCYNTGQHHTCIGAEKVVQSHVLNCITKPWDSWIVTPRTMVYFWAICSSWVTYWFYTTIKIWEFVDMKIFWYTVFTFTIEEEFWREKKSGHSEDSYIICYGIHKCFLVHALLEAIDRRRTIFYGRWINWKYSK